MLGLRSAALIIVLAVLGGCSSGDAFVDRAEMAKSIKKQKLPGYNGQVTVCYDSETPKAERDRLAAEACEVYGLKAQLTSETPWQCRMTAPHRAQYYCYDPDMRMADGSLVNPFSNSQVKAWNRERNAAKAGQQPEAEQ
ncbi:hypothetical protein CCC_03915 [Paramagnetospirillum magnetotacticum MS-1]|uniref:Uncharacterized protein n=1 Tax=Paramagnetospirillum magnetotacticum MS-1 TaxID=272627 RepID=A0A0C2YXA8_PARME|nr:hypothetical protein [Paramagnetospirillum magnetotacticum]KIL99743.1 hypothetical protein CCC_03915 [Paramagnetospirillum magnetotacticum MS-1]